MKCFNHQFLSFILALTVFSVHGDEIGQNVIYLGAGSAKSTNSATTSSKSPITIGYLRLSNSSDTVWGADISGEGTMLDSTWGQNRAVNQATSFNFLIGKKLGNTDNSRVDASLIIGLREKTQSCPSSYLGYQCYADSKPNTTYAVNSGIALTWTYKTALMGVRATGESTQLMLGYRF